MTLFIGLVAICLLFVAGMVVEAVLKALFAPKRAKARQLSAIELVNRRCLKGQLPQLLSCMPWVQEIDLFPRKREKIWTNPLRDQHLLSRQGRKGPAISARKSRGGNAPSKGQNGYSLERVMRSHNLEKLSNRKVGEQLCLPVYGPVRRQAVSSIDRAWRQAWVGGYSKVTRKGHRVVDETAQEKSWVALCEQMVARAERREAASVRNAWGVAERSALKQLQSALELQGVYDSLGVEAPKQDVVTLAVYKAARTARMERV